MKKHYGFSMRLVVILALLLVSAANLYAQRCQAITKKGTQCKRNAQAGSIYCWQHTRMYGTGTSETSSVAPKDTTKQSIQPSKTKSGSEYRQCMATTKKGKRCSRRAQAGSDYCWQHSR